MVVDSTLKEKTMQMINPNRKQRPFLQMGFITKGLTLMSTFMLLVVLSMNLLFRADPESNLFQGSAPSRSNVTESIRDNGIGSKPKDEANDGLSMGEGEIPEDEEEESTDNK